MTSTNQNERRGFWRISSYYFVVYMSGGSFFAYIALYYAHIGLSNAEVGMLATLGAIVAIIAQPFWGVAADKAKVKNMILLVAVFGSAVTVWLVPLADATRLGLFAAFAVFTIFQCAPHPISDAMTLEICQKRKFNFSTIRTIGSLGYALLAFLAGQIFAYNIMLIFPVYSALMFGAFFIALSLPKVKGHRQAKEKKRFTDILKNRKLSVLYIYTAIIQTTLAFSVTFHAIYSAEFGIGPDILGIGIMIGSFAQFPFMLLFPKINKRVSIHYILCVAGLTQALRWLMFAFFLNHITIYFIWALHGTGFIVFYLCLADYVSKNVEPQQRASGQAMNALILGGISRILGSSLGGLGAQFLGIGPVFFISGLLCVAATVVFFVVMKSH